MRGRPKVGCQVADLGFEHSVDLEWLGLLKSIMSGIDRLNQCDI